MYEYIHIFYAIYIYTYTYVDETLIRTGDSKGKSMERRVGAKKMPARP